MDEDGRGDGGGTAWGDSPEVDLRWGVFGEQRNFISETTKAKIERIRRQDECKREPKDCMQTRHTSSLGTYPSEDA